VAVLALAPDLSMLGYLAGGGYWVGARFALLVAAVWAGHIGADRLLGYGLKYPTGFRDTYLGKQRAPADALADAE
jgi:hypothetical protein